MSVKLEEKNKMVKIKWILRYVDFISKKKKKETISEGFASL